MEILLVVLLGGFCGSMLLLMRLLRLQKTIPQPRIKIKSDKLVQYRRARLAQSERDERLPKNFRNAAREGRRLKAHALEELYPSED